MSPTTQKRKTHATRFNQTSSLNESFNHLPTFDSGNITRQFDRTSIGLVVATGVFLGADIAVFSTWKPLYWASGWFISSLGGSSSAYGLLAVGIFGLSCVGVWRLYGLKRTWALYFWPVLFFDRLLLMGVVAWVGRFKVMGLHAMNLAVWNFPGYPLNIYNNGVQTVNQYCPQGMVCSYIGNNWLVLGVSAFMVGIFTVRYLPPKFRPLLSALAFSVAVFSLLNWPTAIYASDFDAHLLTIPALVRQPLGLGILFTSAVAGFLALIPKRRSA